jgi:uncharacterized metal-binding protein YceD (DUF177 family)
MLASHIGMPQLRDMAGRSEQISADFKLDDMPRLEGLLHPDADMQRRKIEVKMQLHIGAQGFPEATGNASGALTLLCQRCLGALEWPVDLDFELVVLDSEADFDEIEDRFDAVVAGEDGILLAGVIEDELLGSLPLAPMHETSENCSAVALLNENETSIEVDGHLSDSDDSSSDLSSEDVHRPFADLSALLGSNAGSDDQDKT